MLLILRDILLYLTLAVMLRLFVFSLSCIKGSSMLPTLQDGDWVLVWRLSYLLHTPKRQDVIICHYPGRRMKQCKWIPMCFIKRVIGIPGDLIEIDHGTVLIDGHPLAEPYLDPDKCNYERSRPLRRLGRQDFYVLGDHRDRSNDSRSVGPIRRNAVYGRAVCIIWPPKRWQKIR